MPNFFFRPSARAPVGPSVSPYGSYSENGKQVIFFRKILLPSTYLYGSLLFCNSEWTISLSNGLVAGAVHPLLPLVLCRSDQI